MPLGWNEIRHRAIKFAKSWADARSEAADKQTFWNEFFDVFGLSRRTLGSFEVPVRKLTGHDGAIDLFWPGNLIVEHKSRGGNLDKAQSQAFEYIHGLVNERRHKEVPRYVIVSDFARIVLYDLEPEEQRDLPLFAGRRVQVAAEFNLAEFHRNIRPFAFIAGYKQQKLDPEDPANIEAAQIMADLHDALKAGGYTGHELRQFLVRILFCLFAEDTGIFPQPRQLELYLKNHTAEDGSDLGPKLAELFDVLNTPEDMHMAWVRYVCGRLKSDYRYSAGIVYNNFPWPQSATAEQKAVVERAAQAVLDARAQFPASTLADLYDPVAMPPVLAKAHADLDRVVDRCYRKEPFASDRARVEFLFALYEKLTAPLIATAKVKRKRTLQS